MVGYRRYAMDAVACQVGGWAVTLLGYAVLGLIAVILLCVAGYFWFRAEFKPDPPREAYSRVP